MPENEVYAGEGVPDDEGINMEEAVAEAKAMGAMEIDSLVMLCIQLAAKLGPHVVKAIQDVMRLASQEEFTLEQIAALKIDKEPEDFE